MFEWEDGYRRVEAARSDPARHRLLGRVVMAVEDELRKRLGSRFTVTELAACIASASDILLDVGMAAMPPGTDLSDVSAAWTPRSTCTCARPRTSPAAGPRSPAAPSS